MSFAVTAAVVGGVASVGAGAIGLGASAIGAAGAGALGLAGLGASAIGGLAGGAGSLLFGGPAPGTTVGQQMAAVADPYYYETFAGSGGILGGVTSAASSTIGYLGELVPGATGLFQLIKPPEQKVVSPVPGAVPSVTAPSVTTPGIAKSPLPIFGRQPAVMTVGAAAPKETNLILYIVLAALAFLLFRKK